MDTLKRHLPFCGQEGLQELRKIAIRFEEKIYTSATSQSDYLRKISLKMLTMESKSQNTMANSLPSNSGSNSKNLPDAGSLGMQSQIGNTIPVPMGANQGQARQQLLAQNMQNNITATGLQGASNLTSAMSGGGGLPQTSVPNVGQNTNLQSMQGISGVSQNSVANSMGQGVSANMYANTQRQMQGRQQVLAQQQQQQPQLQQQQQQQQQPQNPQQILYQQQLPQQYRQKYPQGNIQNSHMQSQQNLLQSSQQPVMQSNLQQNQQSSVQQSQSMLPQNSQSVLRQHSQIQPQSMLPNPQQQQQLLGQQSNSTSLHPNQLLGQQNGMPDMQQQQRLLGQQNNLSNLQQQSQQQLMGQQPLGSQGNVPGLHQQQQQQMLGTQSGNSGMQNNQHPVHMLQQTKLTMLQQNLQNSTALLPSQGQHSQSQMPPQQLMSQIQSQPGQLQQLGMQQQQNPLHRDIQQRLQSSGPLLQSQNMLDQQKQQLFQSQRTILDAPSTSLDSTAQTGNANGGDWQEEVYQKIKTMKEAYLPELNEMYVKIAGKLQQHDTLPQQPKNEQVEKLKIFKTMLERIMTFLQVQKSNILPTFKEKLGVYERQIINFLHSNRPRKLMPSMQQSQLAPSHAQQQQSQIPQMQPQENSMGSQVQSMNVQGSVNTLQQGNVTSLQHNSMSSLSGAPNASQSMMNSLQSNSNMDPSQGNTLNTIQQVAVGMQPVSAPHQVNMNSLSSQNGMGSLQPNLSSLQPNPNMLQHQQFKQQEQQMLQNHQMKQKLQQQHMQPQQYLQKQQLQQQQQLLQQTKLQQNAQLQAHQMPQLPQMNDMDMKMRQQLGVKVGFQQNQRSIYHQQLKSGSPFPISSPQLLQATSPQMPQHSSPQIDQQNLLPSLTKTGTPLQSANSPFIVPSPSTPLNQSPMSGDSEKATSGVSGLPSAGAVGHQQAAVAVTPAQSLAIDTPGISASPLLAEFTGPVVTHGRKLSSFLLFVFILFLLLLGLKIMCRKGVWVSLW